MQPVDEPINNAQTKTNPRPFTVCFICTANMCRSAMAQGLMQARLDQTGLAENVRILGGGTRAAAGYPATREAVEELRTRGIDLSTHRSHPTDRSLLETSDLVLAATTDHARDLCFEFPDLAHKIHTLRGYGRPEDWDGIENVDDPVGMGSESYRLTADLLDEHLERLWPLLMEMLEAFSNANSHPQESD